MDVPLQRSKTLLEGDPFVVLGSFVFWALLFAVPLLYRFKTDLVDGAFVIAGLAALLL